MSAGARRVARGWTELGTRHHLGEGARWHDDGLLFVDLLDGDLYRWTGPGPPTRVLHLDVPLGAVAPFADGSARWVAARGSGVAELSAGREVRALAQLEHGAAVPVRVNDGACDPAGRFWVGSMAVDGTGRHGSLFRVGADGSAHRVLSGLGVPNGPAFTADGATMYLADSADRSIVRFPVDPATGALGDPVTIATIRDGRPDGMTVDDRGRLWVAIWGAGEVRCLSRDGVRLGGVAVPTPHPTSVCFGGGRMVVTTARRGLVEPGRWAGAVLSRATPTVTAPPVAPFGRPGGG